MKFKLTQKIMVAVAAIFLITSCSDDVDSIGKGIQPGTDDIILEIDEVIIKAETVDLNKDLYVRTDKALLGMISDPIMGDQKADFLTEFFAANAEFKFGDGKVARVDSVQFQMAYLNSNFVGDSISPMGISIYELTEKLDNNFYTNVNPLDYTDKKTIWGQRFFIPKDLEAIGKGKLIEVALDKNIGVRLYNKWKEEVDAGKKENILTSTERLREFIKGVYITSDFNNKAMIEFSSVITDVGLYVYYHYDIYRVNADSTLMPDSTKVGMLPLPIGAEAIKLNRVTNSPLESIIGNNPSEIAEMNKIKSFIKSPSGIVTKITIPLGEIKRKGIAKVDSKDFNMNSATFSLTGFTEEENKLGMNKRPNGLLLINKDSIGNFFEKTTKFSDKIAYTKILARNATNNIYYFNSYHGTNNISSLINHYLKKEEEIETLEYYVIPIEYNGQSVSTSPFSSVGNLFSSTAAILRTDEEFMKMSLVFSRHKQMGEK